MNTNRLAVASSVLAAFALTGCSDSVQSTTEPMAKKVSGPSFQTLASLNPTNIDNLFVVCKQGTPGVISITGQVTTKVTVNDNGINGDADDCETVFNSNVSSAVQIRATELAADNPNVNLVSVTHFVDSDGAPLAPADIGANFRQYTFNPAFHGIVVVFTNAAIPAPSCTYTKGWYRNNGSSTVIAVDGRTIAQAQAIFNATPGKPGSVTWEGDNNTLNLYQQLLAALNNLDGNALGGPPAVDAAIAAALAGTGGIGTNITLAPGTDVSGLIETLSNFNEGEFAGFPHCDDEVNEAD